MIPKELRYLQTHEWAKREQGSDIITMGLTDYAIEQLGDIVFLELPTVGDKVKKESEFCTIESVKVASELYAPITVQVCEITESLPDDLEQFSADPYNKAWIAKIKADDISEFETLMTAEDYEKQLKG